MIDQASPTADLLLRLETSPISRQQLRSRLLVGAATFFDAFDLLSLAFVLPALTAEWSLSTPRVGFLIAAGYLGQLIGALIFGSRAERHGRVRVIAETTALMSVLAVGCAAATGFWSLLSLRLLQGLGIGGQMPVAAVYINELSRASNRGRWLMTYDLVFPFGLLVAAQIGALVVPTLGWRVMFLMGGIPGLAVAAFLWRLPESPRWLMAKGRVAEANAVMQQITRPPLVASASPGAPAFTSQAAVSAGTHSPLSGDSVLSASYRHRTLVVWSLWAVAGFCTNGLVNWMPTLYTSVYKMPLADALRAAAINNVAQIAVLIACALAIDRVGRRRWTVASLIAGAVVLGILGSIGADSVSIVVAIAPVAYGIVSSVNAVLYLYTPEIYPTRFRARATAWATCWVRLFSAAGQVSVGYLLTAAGPASVFFTFGAISIAGAVAATLMLETSRRQLEEIAR